MKDNGYEDIFLVCLLLSITGCAERLTQEQWIDRYKPDDANQANAMSILQTRLIEAKSRAESQSMMDKFKIACAIGAVASVIAVVCGFRLLGAAGLLGCITGFGLAYAGSEYAKYVAIGGLVYGVAVGGFAIYVIIRALREVIHGEENAKKIDGNIGAVLKAGNNIIQSSWTQKIVKWIKGEK